MGLNINIMNTIMEQKDKDLKKQEVPGLNPETIALAEHKRSTFDLPTNAVKVDPLR